MYIYANSSLNRTLSPQVQRELHEAHEAERMERETEAMASEQLGRLEERMQVKPGSLTDNEIYYTHAVLSLVWSIHVVIFVAQQQLIEAYMEISSWPVSSLAAPKSAWSVYAS